MEDAWLTFDRVARETGHGLTDVESMTRLLESCWDDKLSTERNLAIIIQWLDTGRSVSSA